MDHEKGSTGIGHEKNIMEKKNIPAKLPFCHWAFKQETYKNQGFKGEP